MESTLKLATTVAEDIHRALAPRVTGRYRRELVLRYGQGLGPVIEVKLSQPPALGVFARLGREAWRELCHPTPALREALAVALARLGWKVTWKEHHDPSN